MLICVFFIGRFFVVVSFGLIGQCSFLFCFIWSFLLSFFFAFVRKCHLHYAFRSSQFIIYFILRPNLFKYLLKIICLPFAPSWCTYSWYSCLISWRRKVRRIQNKWWVRFDWHFKFTKIRFLLYDFLIWRHVEGQEWLTV